MRNVEENLSGEVKTPQHSGCLLSLLVFSGRSSTSPCLTLYLLGIQLFLYVPNLTEQSSANHTSK